MTTDLARQTPDPGRKPMDLAMGAWNERVGGGDAWGSELVKGTASCCRCERSRAESSPPPSLAMPRACRWLPQAAAKEEMGGEGGGGTGGAVAARVAR